MSVRTDLQSGTTYGKIIEESFGWCCKMNKKFGIRDLARIRIVIVLLLCLCLGIAGCVGTPAESPSFSEEEEETDSQGSVCYFLPFFDRYDEYCEFIASQEMPDGFVRYECIQGIGSFAGFYVHDDSVFSYSYELYDESFYEIILSVTHMDEGAGVEQGDKNHDERLTVQELGLSGEVPRTISSDAAVTELEHNGIVYTYNDGKLYSVKWQTESTLFTLSGTMNVCLCDYSAGEKATFLNRLLNLETAKAAIADMGAVYMERVPTPSPSPDPTPSPSPAPTY